MFAGPHALSAMAETGEPTAVEAEGEPAKVAAAIEEKAEMGTTEEQPQGGADADNAQVIEQEVGAVEHALLPKSGSMQDS